jgi:hypothetical protein
MALYWEPELWRSVQVKGRTLMPEYLVIHGGKEATSLLDSSQSDSKSTMNMLPQIEWNNLNLRKDNNSSN